MSNLNSDDQVITRPIIGCAMRVIALGHGLHEKPYENALCVELRAQGIPLEQQPRFPNSTTERSKWGNMCLT